MPPLAERLPDFRTAGTCLARAVGIHLNKHTLGTLSLIRDHVQELPPARIVNRLGKVVVFNHALDVQFLSRDQPVSVNQGTAQVVVEICSLPTNKTVGALQQHHGIPSALRAFLAPRYAPLCHSQGTLGVPVVARVGYFGSVAQRGEARQADIDTDHVRAERQRLGLNLAQEHRKPVSRLALDSERFNLALNRARNLDSDFPDLRDSQPVSAQSVPDLPKRQTVVATKGTKAWKPSFLTRLDATKESLERNIDALQGVFQCVTPHVGYVLSLGFYLRQLNGLIEVTDRFAFETPCFASLLQSRVIQLRADRKVAVKCLNLSLRWVDSVAVSLYH